MNISIEKQIIRFLEERPEQARNILKEFPHPEISDDELLNILNKMVKRNLIKEGATTYYQGQKVVIDWRLP